MRSCLLTLCLLASCTEPSTPTRPSTERKRDLGPLGYCDLFDSVRLRDPRDLSRFAEEPERIAELGIRLARPHRPKGHAFARNLVQRGDDWDWSVPDAVVQRAQEHDISLFVTLQPRMAPEARGAPGVMVPLVPKEEIDAWRTFVRRTVERYDGDGVDDMPGLTLPVYAWEVGNEPSCPPGDDKCPYQFYDMVRTAWEEAHRADPAAVVLVGGAAPLLRANGQRDPDVDAVYRSFFALGGAAYTDALNFHTLVGSDAPNLAAHVAAWRELAPGLPIWWTEMGGWFPQGAVDPTHDGEARWVQAQLDQALALGIEHVFWCRGQGELDRNPELLETLAAWQARHTAGGLSP